MLTYAKAKVTRLTLARGKEKSRQHFADIAGGKNADGITFDKQGRMYVTAGALFRVSRDGKKVESLGAAYGANADFGVGALGCSDLYTAGNGKGIFRFENDTPGGEVPWHRAGGEAEGEGAAALAAPGPSRPSWPPRSSSSWSPATPPRRWTWWRCRASRWAACSSSRSRGPSAS